VQKRKREQTKERSLSLSLASSEGLGERSITLHYKDIFQDFSFPFLYSIGEAYLSKNYPEELDSKKKESFFSPRFHLKLVSGF